MHILTSEPVPDGARRAAAAVVVACATAVAMASWPGEPVVPATLAVAIGIAAAVVDVRERRLPDALVALVAAVPVVAVVLAGGPPMFWRVLAGAALMGAPVLVFHLVDPAAMGFGDVKFAAALGSAVGLVDWRWSLVALAVASGASALAGVARRARSVPFGPGLVAGALIAVVGAAMVGGGALAWR